MSLLKPKVLSLSKLPLAADARFVIRHSLSLLPPCGGRPFGKLRAFGSLRRVVGVDVRSFACEKRSLLLVRPFPRFPIVPATRGTAGSGRASGPE
jgi:hypothetical protein